MRTGEVGGRERRERGVCVRGWKDEHKKEKIYIIEK